MSPSITIEKFKLEGFRAYLQPQTISLRSGKTPLSLAIFAPNARGKSSLVDSFEYYFSEEGTLKRLGKRSAQTHAGPVAMEHVDAKKEGITPTVHFWFRQGMDKFDESRPISTPLAGAARKVLQCTKVPFVIHGYELREFVEGRTPGDQYKDLAAWFGLDPLLTIQRNLRLLRRETKAKVESTAESKERLRDLSRATDGKVSTSNDSELCSWFNDEVLSHLDNSLKLVYLSDQDYGFQELVKRETAEQEQLGLGALRRLAGLIEDIFKQSGEKDGRSSGHITAFERAVLAHSEAAAQEAHERFSASSAIFSKVWKSAKELFDNGVDFDNCPICDTDFLSSVHESRAGINFNLGKKISELAKYHTAERASKAAEEALHRIESELRTAIGTASSSLKEAGYECSKALGYLETLELWNVQKEVPESKQVMNELTRLSSLIMVDIDKVIKQQGEHTYSNALLTARELLRIKADLVRIERTKSELKSLHVELERQDHFINTEIVTYTQGLVAQLEGLVAALYSYIQGNDEVVPPIRLELPGQENADQQRAQLLIDFASNRRSVVPSGYLSDSQIHTLALALRLAAIHLFNHQAPIIVLDDVVTSYDADHRKAIAGVLAKHFSDFQILLVTHDEQFFNLLQDQLSPTHWRFKRITEVRPQFGPVFHDHRTPDQVIQAKLDAGNSAAAEMRRTEEEWLLGICRGFGTKVVIRHPDRVFQYDRSELADSLAHFLKGIGMLPPKTPEISNSFLHSLQKGVVENFANHFSDNPYRSGSVGDERARWKEFKYFRDLFVCPSCDKSRFQRPRSLNKPVCLSCETPFAFRPPDSKSAEPL